MDAIIMRPAIRRHSASVARSLRLSRSNWDGLLSTRGVAAGFMSGLPMGLLCGFTTGPAQGLITGYGE